MSPRRPLRIGVLADDFTGAGDVALSFEEHGLRTEMVIWEGGPPPRPPEKAAAVWILDTESRNLPSKNAREKVRRAMQCLRAWPADFVYKKIDSTLRGPLGAELEEFLKYFKAPIAFVPAFPKMGRFTRGGVHWVEGRPLHRTAFAGDPRHPIRTSRVKELLGLSGDPSAEMVWIPDVVRQADLRKIARTVAEGPSALRAADCPRSSAERAEGRPSAAVGAAGLAEELARLWRARGELRGQSAPHDAARYRPGLSDGKGADGPSALSAELRGQSAPQRGDPSSARPAPPVLVVIGSAHPKSRRQAQALMKHFGPRLVDLSKDRGSRGTKNVFPAGSVYLIEAPRRRGSPDDVMKSLMRRADVWRRRLGVRRFVATGGETACALGGLLRVRRWRILGRVERGVPVCVSPEGKETICLVSKPGGYGKEDALVKSVRRLRRYASDKK